MNPQEFRRHLRKESTSSERAMWFYLRNRKFLELKFRRQHSIQSFTVDFYCEALKLIIEVDGGIHENLGQHNYDYERETYFKNNGYHVYRVDNLAVNRFMENVLEDLKLFIRGIESHSSPQ